jgi:hypothetical protein
VTHAALLDRVLLVILVVMVLLLVSCIMAVVVAPPQRPGSHAPQHQQAAAPPPLLPSRVPLATAPPPPLPRRQRVTAPTIGRGPRRPPRDDETTELAALPSMLHDRLPQPKVSGNPPWEPAPKPSGLDR